MNTRGSSSCTIRGNTIPKEGRTRIKSQWFLSAHPALPSTSLFPRTRRQLLGSLNSRFARGLTFKCAGDVVVYVKYINQPSLPVPFLFRSCVCFCLHGPFNCISFHKFSRQLSAFSLCSSGLISALLVLSTIYLFMKAPLSPDIILRG